ncbi:MAG: acyl-CoA dehydrogenase [Chloroflexi bacterium]|nr:acyl-CoA dehydrogenase [Chloroflexota bacterium]
MLPRLRELAAETDALRRVPDETIQAFREAGFIKVFQPARYGGYELDYGTVQLELSPILGRAGGSSAWVASVLASHGWLTGMFAPAAQESVWGADNDTIVGTAFSPDTGLAKRVDGGWQLSGQWKFSSGVDAASWIILGGPLQGERRRPRWFLLPRSEWQIVDTWFAAGLRGTGSKDVFVPGAFVADDYMLDPEELDGRPTPGSAVNQSYIYRLPLSGFFPFNVAPPAIGVARGAVEEYIAQTAGRPDRAGHAPRQLRIAESAAEVDAAEALLRADAVEIARMGAAGQTPDKYLQARYLRDLGFAAILCTRAVDRLATALGAHGILDDNPVQRAFRDVHAIANHVAVNWDTQALRYSQLALGLD